MTGLLARLFGRLPIGWLQLMHNKPRLAAALAGVAFANVLVFMQLGFLGALRDSAVLAYRAMAADILISAPDANTFSDGSNLPRQRLYGALAVPGVAAAAPFYTAKLDWERADGESGSLQVFGIDPDAHPFRDGFLDDGALDALRLPDRVLLDDKTRGVGGGFFAAIDEGEAYAFEVKGRTLDAVGTFTIGAGFEADGHMIVSDQTFLRLFPGRASGALSHVFVTVDAGVDVNAVVERLSAALNEGDALARTLKAAADADQAYQTTERPVGVVFGFGVVIGVLVGVIIVYQVLITDVADHLREYATFKAIGYKDRYFLGIVFEEAAVLALLGFVPGFLVAYGLYQLTALGTGLPVAMTGTRALLVFLGTLVMCAVSGAIATRRLAAADPADLF